MIKICIFLQGCK